MHRLIVVILSAVDAAIAAAVGIAATLAPLTLLWVLGMGGTADWGALWPASATVWQFGNLVPLQVTLPGDYLAVAGIDPGAASFVLSLAPLAFATLHRDLRRALGRARVAGGRVGHGRGHRVAGLRRAGRRVIALTSADHARRGRAVAGDPAPRARVRDPAARRRGRDGVARSGRRVASPACATASRRPRTGGARCPGSSCAARAVVLRRPHRARRARCSPSSLVLRGGEVIALFEAAHVDALGATVVTLAQLAYLPTLAIWGMAFVAGPGLRGRRPAPRSRPPAPSSA